VIDRLVIRGYACVFGVDAMVAGTRERVAPKAFTWLWRNIPILWGTHDPNAYVLARTGNRTASLFQDAFGLGFEAELQWTGAGVAAYRAVANRSLTPFQCSVYFADYNADAWCGNDGVPTRYITSAKIDHIAIVRNAAYHDTRAWPAWPLDQLPSDLRDIAQRWEAGKEKHDQKTQRAARAGQRWWKSYCLNADTSAVINRNSARNARLPSPSRPAANRSLPVRRVPPAARQHTPTEDRRPTRGQVAPKTNHHIPRFSADIEQILADRLRGRYPKDRSVFG
jgi:hypothetical protein